MGGLNLSGSGAGNADPWGAATTNNNAQNGAAFGGGFSDFGSAPVVAQRVSLCRAFQFDVLC